MNVARFITADARQHGAPYNPPDMRRGLNLQADNPAGMALTGHQFDAAIVVCTARDFQDRHFVGWLYADLATRFAGVPQPGRLRIEVLV